MTQEDQKHQSKKLWGGRFSGQTDPIFEKFNASISFDKRLWAADIRGSIAYANALSKASVITPHECSELIRGLNLVYQEWETGKFVIQDATDEDIHTANERRLTELIGAAIAGKLHTGRSRNDQVATDLRLWLSDEITHLRTSLHILIESVIHRATHDIDILMPGYTHLQLAQPIRWSHWLLSYASAWHRDAQRLDELAKRVRVLPLGSGALAGNPFGIDRHAIAKELGFEGISSNSVDAVSDRDFVAEFLFWASLTMIHISQFAEDLIIFASKKLVQIADAYSTGSSLMPQKKNPDALELLRGKSGRVFGSLSSLIVLLKSLPKAYNKDLQEDKEPLFDAWMTLKGSLAIVAGAVATTRPVKEAMLAALSPDMLATDLAEYLVRKGVPFRDTHHVAGAAVKMAEDRKVPLNTLTVQDLKTLHSAFDTDVSRVWDYENSVNSRDSDGGTSYRSVTLQITQLTQWLKQQGHTLSEAQ